MSKVKIGRNDPCSCGSNMKYKKCCESKNTSGYQYDFGQEISSEKIKTTIEAFKIMYSNHNVIDISNDLSESTYKKYQVKNYNKKTIMLAERSLTNEKVFESRVRDVTSDIIVMYKGSFRTFPFNDLANLMESICEMIDESDNRKD